MGELLFKRMNWDDLPLVKTLSEEEDSLINHIARIGDGNHMKILQLILA